MLDAILARSSVTQRSWLSGFLAGIDARAGEAVKVPAQTAAIPLTILYASESGNSERLAGSMAKQARGQGFKPRLVDMADLELAELPKAGALALIAATWGEGEPPARAARAYHALMAEDAPRLDGVPFAVLALGDSAYPDFCATGAILDARLEVLGGRRALARVDCDLDFAEPAKAWVAAAFGVLKPAGSSVPAMPVQPDSSAAFDEVAVVGMEVRALVDLNSSRSEKETIHIELGLEDMPPYEPGDALEVFPNNDPATVTELMAAFGLKSDVALAEQLEKARDINTLSMRTLETYANITGQEAVGRLAETPEARDWVAGRQLIDLALAYPAEITADQLLSLTRPLAPRAYSIASSRKEIPDEAHLLIAAVRYESYGRHRRGVASTHIAERVRRGDTLSVRLRHNNHFRLPASDKDIIMVGPGTGIAPFRAFVQERRAVGASGRNWLFFGDRTSTHDFLYQIEWQDALADGSLTALDAAFSRDAPKKVYVQDRLWDKRRELIEWLENGAHLYVCGDASRMAKDVRAALVRIAIDIKGFSDEAAQGWVENLERERRYLQDVY